MSSRNRRSQGDQNDPFNITGGQIDETPASPLIPSMREVDGKGYGAPALMVQQETVKAIALSKIIPDPSQPRRAVPFAVRQEWEGSMETLFPAWEVLIQQQENEHFSIHKMLTGGDDIRNPEPKPLEAALMKIIDLAITIQRDGLANPITCVLHGVDTFYLETGERRWLAYHLLLWATGADTWKSIPVRRVEQWSVWRQASENNVRDNLNAIGKARQFALLLMDLLTAEGIEFQPIHTFEHEQGFYAQVADGDTYRIPDGKGEMLIAAMGVSNRIVTTRYRNLLKLPQLVWVIADDLNWAERKIRDLTTLPEEIAVHRAIKWASMEGMLLPMGSSSTDLLPMGNRSEATDKDEIGDFVQFLEKSKMTIERRLKRVNQLQALELIEQYETWIKNIKRDLLKKN